MGFDDRKMTMDNMKDMMTFGDPLQGPTVLYVQKENKCFISFENVNRRYTEEDWFKFQRMINATIKEMTGRSSEDYLVKDVPK